MMALTVSPIQRSPAPTVEETAWALSRACGLTNATAGRPPPRRALTNPEGFRVCARAGGEGRRDEEEGVGERPAVDPLEVVVEEHELLGKPPLHGDRRPLVVA